MPATGNNLRTVDTARVALVPEELFRAGGEAELMRFCGFGSDFSVGVSAPSGGIVAVVAANGIEEGERVTSPLLLLVDECRERFRRGRVVGLHVTENATYVVVWDGALRAAHALPDSSADSVLYFMQTLGRDYPLRRFDIRLSGPLAPEISVALRPYYKVK